jgi:hypothetical protein
MRTHSTHKFIFLPAILLFMILIASGCSNPPAATTESQAAGITPTGPAAASEPASQPSPEPTNTAEPAPTITPQPTVPSEVKFSLDNAQKELPENFMEQITYFGHAGGGGDWDVYNPCEEFPRSVPAYKYEPKGNTCLYCDYDLTTCGWKPNEKVRITVQLRGRGSFKTSEQASEFGYLEYKLPASADDLPGDYTISISGQSGKLKTTFFKDAPTETGSVLIGDQLVLFNFVPYEIIRLTIYQVNQTQLDIATRRVDEKFFGWQDFQVDSTGSLHVQIDLGPDTTVEYQVNAEQSGIYPRAESTNTNTKEVTVYYASFGCNNQESSFGIDYQIRITAPDGAPFFRVLEEYQEPDQVIPVGETGRIIDGPHCFEEKIYWQVTFANDLTGWMPQQERMSENMYFEVVK